MSQILSHLSQVDPILGAVISTVGPCRLVPQMETEPFQALAHAIAHQQLHAAAASSILKRFIETCGAGAFPAADRVLATPDLTLRGAGFSASKIAALKDLARKTIEGIVPERRLLLPLEDTAIIERPTQVRGIGRWTVEMMLIFQLGRPDILPVDDFGVRKGFQLAYGLRKMPRPRVLAAYGERWAPYRSTAAWYLWRAPELHREGTLPAPGERIRLPRITSRRKPRSAPVRKATTRAGKPTTRASKATTRNARSRPASTGRRTKQVTPKRSGR
jgi:DNA-3-methyladenine glycosylase II